MDDLVHVALVGTANDTSDVATLPDIEAVVPPGTREQRLLWQAGALAVYGGAGHIAPTATPPTPAPPDLAPSTPAALTPIIGAMLEGQLDGLAEWLVARIERAGMRLPHGLLPAVFAKPATVEKWRSVVGERGRWLAAHNPAWLQQLGATIAPQDDAELLRTWEEGMPAVRAKALAAMRLRDAAGAREQLVAVLPKEKADLRQSFTEQLAIALGPDDEALLEQLLDDRSQGVRQAAAGVLARQPASAWAQRMRARAAACLRWQRASAPGGVMGRLTALVSAGPPATLEVDVPQELPADWERDGIAANPPSGEGKRAYWLRQLVSHVPPSAWTAGMDLAPPQLLHVLMAHEWSEPLLNGCATAAVRYTDHGWGAELLARSLQDQGSLARHEEALWSCVTPAMREELLAQLLMQGNLDRAVHGLVALDLPWPARVTAHVLPALQLAAERMFASSQAMFNQRVLAVLQLAVLRCADGDVERIAALANECAARIAQMESTAPYYLGQARNAAALAEARHIIMKEMPL